MNIEQRAINDDLSFRSASEFKHYLNKGWLCNFDWLGKSYHICSIWQNENLLLSITDLESMEEFEYQTVEELLEHRIGNDCLKNIITQVKVTELSY